MAKPEEQNGVTQIGDSFRLLDDFERGELVPATPIENPETAAEPKAEHRETHANTETAAGVTCPDCGSLAVLLNSSTGMLRCNQCNRQRPQAAWRE